MGLPLPNDGLVDDEPHKDIGLLEELGVVGWVGNVVVQLYGSRARPPCDANLPGIYHAFDEENPRQLLKYIAGDQTAYMQSIIMIYIRL